MLAQATHIIIEGGSIATLFKDAGVNWVSFFLQMTLKLVLYRG